MLSKKIKMAVAGSLIALLVILVGGWGELEASSQSTSVLGQAPGAVRGDFANSIRNLFPRETGHKVSTIFRGCFDSADRFWAGANEGKLRANVLMVYGRTGESPEGTDIYAALEASRPLLEPMSGRYTLRPEFAELIDKKGHFQTAYVDTVVIIYNPNLINRANVPKSWAELADFAMPRECGCCPPPETVIAVPAWGCFAIRTLTYLYNIVGEEKFKKIIANGKVPPLVLSRNDRRDKCDNPLSAGCAVKAVLGTTADEIRCGIVYESVVVGIGSLQRAELRQGLEDGTLGVIWPEEGAMAFPYLMAVRKNPNEADLALLDFLVKGSMQEIIFNAGWSSTLTGGPVHPIIKENNFDYYFMPLAKLRDQATHRRIIEIVEKVNKE